jgi:hypothetical protein
LNLRPLGYERRVLRLMYVDRSHELRCELALKGVAVSHRLIRTPLYAPAGASPLASPIATASNVRDRFDELRLQVLTEQGRRPARDEVRASETDRTRRERAGCRWPDGRCGLVWLTISW